MPTKKRSTSRPAETATGVSAAIAVLVAAIFNVTDRDVLMALPVLIAAVPSLVTYFVALAESPRE